MTATSEDYQAALETSLAQGAKLTECKTNLKTNYIPKGDQIKAAVDPNNQFNQPDVPYDASYPYNNATKTPSGHVFELDDTPGSERINIQHRTGTFQEIHPDGGKTEKIVNDNFQVVVKDNLVYIMGNHQQSIQGDVKVFIQGNVKAEVEGNVDFTVGGNMNIEVKGIFTASASQWTFIGPFSVAGILRVTDNIITQASVIANKSIKALIDLIADRHAVIGVDSYIGRNVTVGNTLIAQSDITSKTDVFGGTAPISLVNHVHTEQGDGAKTSASQKP
jgi:hypothetical protein